MLLCRPSMAVAVQPADLVLMLCVQDFQAFARQHPEVLQATGVSAEDALAKARILALLSMAARSNTLSFASIRVSLLFSSFTVVSSSTSIKKGTMEVL